MLERIYGQQADHIYVAVKALPFAFGGRSSLQEAADISFEVPFLLPSATR